MIQELIADPESVTLHYVLSGKALLRQIRWRVELNDAFWVENRSSRSVAIDRAEIVAVDFWKKSIKPLIPTLESKTWYAGVLQPPMPSFKDLLPEICLPKANPFPGFLKPYPQGDDWFEDQTEALLPYCEAAWDFVDQASRVMGQRSVRRDLHRHLVLRAMEHFEGFVFAP